MEWKYLKETSKDATGLDDGELKERAKQLDKRDIGTQGQVYKAENRKRKIFNGL